MAAQPPSPAYCRRRSRCGGRSRCRASLAREYGQRGEGSGKGRNVGRSGWLLVPVQQKAAQPPPNVVQPKSAPSWQRQKPLRHSPRPLHWLKQYCSTGVSHVRPPQPAQAAAWGTRNEGSSCPLHRHTTAAGNAAQKPRSHDSSSRSGGSRGRVSHRQRRTRTRSQALQPCTSPCHQTAAPGSRCPTAGCVHGMAAA